MAEFKNTVADAQVTISFVPGLEAGVPTRRFYCPSKRLKGGRSYEANLGIAREAIERFLKAVDAHCRRGERGLMILGPTEALSLSERAEEVLDAVQALDLTMKTTVAPVPDAGPGVWELTRKLGRGGESADAQAAIHAATYAVGYPIERLNSPDGPTPGGPNRRYRAGEIVHDEDLRRLRRAQAALELAADDVASARDPKKHKSRAPRQPAALTDKQKRSLELHEKLGSFSAVAKEMGVTPKTVRDHIAAAKRKVDAIAHVRMPRPRTQPLPKQV